MTDYQFDEEAILVSPVVDPQDIEQEREIRLFLGQPVSRSVLRLQAQTYDAVLFSDSLPVNAEPIQWGGPLEPDFSTIEAILTWSQDQSSAIKNKIYQFLDEPTEKSLHSVLVTLKREGALPQTEEVKQSPDSLAQAVLRLLKARPHSLEELYQYSRSQHAAKRPEAAIRQIIRRFTKSNIIQENNNVYSIS